MTFINIILENSSDKLAKLYGPAFKASQNPENGITIHNKSAYHVIKDCADIAHKYIPLYVFGEYLEPFSKLKGKFKKSDIVEFVQSTKKITRNEHLLCLIIHKSNEKNKAQEALTIKTNTFDSSDPYGDYGSGSGVEDTKKYVNQYNPMNDSDTIQLLCELFDVSI
jgi:hypothetical protein